MRQYTLPALALSAILCGTTMVSAAVKKPVKASPKKPPAKTASVQLPGDNGKFGEVYVLRKVDPIYFRLKSAEFTTNQMRIGDRLFVPEANQKLLILHFTIQNPQKYEVHVRWDSLDFTAVDSMNVNHEARTDWGDEKSQNGVGMSLKPAQTLDIYTGIIVPAKGSVPKLIVLPPGEENGRVLRYNLNDPKNKVTPLSEPFADPSDKTGYTALETVPGQLNVAYPYWQFDVTVQKFEYTTQAVADYELEEGYRYLMVTLLMKNESYENPSLRWDTVTPMLLSADGEELRYVDMLLATANRSMSRNPKPGEEITVRLCFSVPEDATPKTLSLKEGEYRTYEFQVP